MRTRKWLRRIGAVVGGLVILYFVAALALTFWPEPTFATDPEVALARISESEDVQEEPQAYEEARFTMRDDVELFGRRFAADADTTVLFVHGVASESSKLNQTAGLIRAAGPVEVVALDLRGHGASGGRPWDIDYIGQYESDLADVVAEIRASKPAGKIVLAGHSMGGGIALRYALLPDAPHVDAYLLFAPNLGINSPTARTEPAEAADPDVEATLKLHVPRILGLALLNAVGVTGLNGLPTMIFNLPPELPMRAYSFRAMATTSPDDHAVALAAVSEPLLVLVGSNDEAFHGEQYGPVVTAHSDGDVEIVDGETHDGILRNEAAMAAVREWLATLESASR
ncbi:MAG: alpha/beta hydrolase [Chloroflexi bacterium]|nr:alpha/beta hydrolase [Chloroflexota bacterium]